MFSDSRSRVREQALIHHPVHHISQVFESTGRTKQMPLNESATKTTQGGELAWSFDALSDDFQIEVTTDLNDRGGNRHPFVDLAQWLYERFVDLKNPNGKADEVAQRGVSGSKVIDGEMHS